MDNLDATRQKQALSLWEVKALTNDYKKLQQALKVSTKNLTKADLETAVRESFLLGRVAISRLLRDPLLPSEIAPTEFRQSLTNDMKTYHFNARVFWNKWLIL